MRVFRVKSGQVVSVPGEFVKVIRGFANGELLIGIADEGDSLADVQRGPSNRSRIVEAWDADKLARRHAKEARSA